MSNTAPRTLYPAGEPVWCWSLGDTGNLYGFCATEAEAHAAWRAESAAASDDLPPSDQFSRWRRVAVSTDVFEAAQVMEALESANETALFEQALELTPDQELDLQTALAIALYDWLDRNKVWRQFNGYEPAPDA